MSATIKSDVNKKKSRTVFSYCSELLSRIGQSPSKPMLATDAAPVNGLTQSQAQEHMMVRRNENTQLAIPFSAQIERMQPLQMVQNNFSQPNQNLTVVESQQVLNINHSTGVHIGNTLVVSGSSPQKNSCNGSYDDKAKKTRTIIELMSSTDLIETQTMQIVARNMGWDGRMVFRDLKISDAEISQIKEQYFHISVEEVVYQLLLRWQRNDDDPTIGQLCTVLWENKNYDCVNELRKYYKQRRRSFLTTDVNDKDSDRKSTCDDH